jgi:transposase
MSNGVVLGRPRADLLLSAAERAYVKRQVRRHRVARSLSARCRIVLKCAEGLPGKVVATELGVCENTVGKWRQRLLQDRIVGLYLSPPTHALVLSVDETSQIQALDREQPVLPMLFAALDCATGCVIGKCYKRHRATEFLDTPKQIDAQVPDDLDIHIIMDNCATHKTAKVRAWLARRPHYHVHVTPTSASWINQVERWFAELTCKPIQRGVHTSTGQLEADIRTFIERHNEKPAPCKWTKSTDEIRAAVIRFALKTQQTVSSKL